MNILLTHTKKGEEFNTALQNFSGPLKGCPIAAAKLHSFRFPPEKKCEDSFQSCEDSFQSCLDSGCPHCKGVSAYGYYHGNGYPKDQIHALKLASESNADGSPYGAAMLAKIFYETDRLKAMPICLRAAQQGLGWAMVRIGTELLKGTNVPQDLKGAHKWLQQAADMNDPEGLCLLAHCFLEGKGVPKNIATAISLYERAKKAGDRHADIGLLLAHKEAVDV